VLSLTLKLSAPADVIADEVPNERDWRVNSARIEPSYIAPSVAGDSQLPAISSM
jgi:hypothetical protein